MGKLSFGVGLGAELRMTEIGEHARVAEECGFHHASWVDQNIVARDITAMMTVAATNTRRIQIGHGVCDPLTTHPATIANQSASLRELTGGRAFAGLGGGGPWGKAMTKAANLAQVREAAAFIKKFSAGEDAEWEGNTWHSTWIRESIWAGKPIPLWMGPHGPKMTELAGEFADVVFSPASNPIIQKFRLEHLERGAEKAGRDFSEIEFWVRCQCYPAATEEEAWRETRSMGATGAMGLYLDLKTNSEPMRELGRRIEKAYPGLIDEMKIVHDNWNLYEQERIDASHVKFVTPRMVDFISMAGTPDRIVDKIRELEKLGVAGISFSHYAIIDQISNMRKIAAQIMPHFR